MFVAAGFMIASAMSCGSSPNLSAASADSPVSNATSSSISLHGSVQAGHLPIAGAAIQVYAAGSTGTASAAQSLLSSSTRSDQNGNFSFTFSCPSPNTEVYVAALGGAPGPSQPENPQSSLMSVLGPCSSVASADAVSINEVTTVGSVWPLSPFMSSVAAVGSAANDASFGSAASLVAQLVSISPGTSPGTGIPSGYAVQTEKLYSLANLLHGCVASAGGAAGDSSSCGEFFSAVTPPGATPPSDTLAAALLMAKSPVNGVGAIFKMASPNGPFQPVLSATPDDWSLPLLPIPAAPDISPAPGTYLPGQAITLSDTTTDAVIHYTTNGSPASAASPVYTAPLLLGANETVNAVATAEAISSAGAASAFAVTPSHLIFSTEPGSALVNSMLLPAPAVSMVDGNGNLLDVSNIPVTVTLSGNSSDASLAGTTTIPLLHGTATFPGLSLSAAGSGYTLAAASPGIAPSTSASFAVTLPSIAISIADSMVALGSTVSGSVVLGEPVGNSGATITLTSSSSILSLPATLTVAAGQTTAAFSTRGLSAGTAQLTASAAGYASSSPETITVAATIPSGGPTVTTIEVLGTVPASQAAGGLGFHIDPGISWEFQAAQAVGSSWIRFDCPWQVTEIQNSNNTPGGYTLPALCAQGLANSKAYGQHPQMNALYGPPYQSVAGLAVTAATPAGSTVVPVSVTSGFDLGKLATACFDSQSKPLCEVIAASGQIAAKYDYPGALIIAVDPSAGTITLATATTVALTTTSTLGISQLLYSPILVPAGGPFLTDPSTQAYVNYARYLAAQIASAGLSGEVGLYNEPNWLGGYWIHGQLLYGQPPPTSLPTDGLNAGVPLAVAATAPIPGVQFMSNFTNLTGFGSLLANVALATQYTTMAHMQQTIASEAFHPYGNNPEEQMWSTPCVHQMALMAAPPTVPMSCILAGGNPGANFKSAVMDSFLPAALGGIPHSISETGINAQIPNVTARFDLRQFLGFQALGVSPIIFYKITNSGSPLDWINPTTQQPYQNYADFQALMSDLKSIALSPVVPVSNSPTPTVVAYSSYYPLDTASFVGAHNATDQANSIAWFVWQHSHTSGVWYQMTSPAPVPVTVTIPTGLSVVKVVDTVTLQPVTYTLTGTSLIYNVADNPIEVLLIPASTPVPSKVKVKAGH